MRNSDRVAEDQELERLRQDLLTKKAAYLEAEKAWWERARVHDQVRSQVVGDINSILGMIHRELKQKGVA